MRLYVQLLPILLGVGVILGPGRVHADSEARAAAAAALDTLERGRFERVGRMFAGDPDGMTASAALRERCLTRLGEILLEAPEVVPELTWPAQESWLAIALFERRRDWSRLLLEAMGGTLPDPGFPRRGPVALAVGLNGLALLEGDPEDENAFLGEEAAPIHITVRLALSVAAHEEFLLRDEALYRLWRLAEADGDTALAVAWADSLVRLVPRSTRVPEVRLTLARSLLGAGEPGEAIDEARLAMPEADSAELRWFLIRSYLTLGFEGEGAREADRLIATFPADPLAFRAWELRLELAEGNPDLYLSLEERLELAEPLLKLPRSGTVVWMMAVVDSTSLTRGVRDRAALALVRHFYRAKQYGNAQGLLDSLYTSPEPEMRTEAELIAARMLRNTGMIEPMEELYGGLVEEGGETGETAAWELAREMESLGRWEAAEGTYSDLLERFPRTSQLRDVAFRRGFVRTRLGRPRDAKGDFRTALQKSGNPADREQAAFWLARTLSELGEADAARDAAAAGLTTPEPADYYGVRLREALEVPDQVEKEPAENAAGFDATLPEDLGDWPDPVRWHYRRGMDLSRLGIVAGARREWSRAARLGDGLYPVFRALSVAAAAYDLYPEGVYWAGRADRMLADGHPLQLGYRRLSVPAAYCGSVVRAAREEDLSPYLLWGLIRQESFYDPRAISRAGAMGLMQLLPATLERMVGEGDAPPLPVESLLLADVNIELGSRFLAARLAEFGNGLLPTLASYNAGEAKSRQWLELAGGDEEEVFVECIGYPETSGYVRRIPRNIWIYRAYYTGAPMPGAGGDDR